MRRIRIIGIGGQGIKLAGEILGKSAILAGYYATQTVSYTPAARGGPIHTDVIISEHPINNPIFEYPDITCILAQYAFEAFKDMIKEHRNSLLIIDDNTVEEINLTDFFILRVPFSRVGGPQVANMVLVGYLARLLTINLDDINFHKIKTIRSSISFSHYVETHREILQIEARMFENAVQTNTPDRFREKNIEAFYKGYNMFMND